MQENNPISAESNTDTDTANTENLVQQADNLKVDNLNDGNQETVEETTEPIKIPKKTDEVLQKFTINGEEKEYSVDDIRKSLASGHIFENVKKQKEQFNLENQEFKQRREELEQHEANLKNWMQNGYQEQLDEAIKQGVAYELMNDQEKQRYNTEKQWSDLHNDNRIMKEREIENQNKAEIRNINNYFHANKIDPILRDTMSNLIAETKQQGQYDVNDFRVLDQIRKIAESMTEKNHLERVSNMKDETFQGLFKERVAKLTPEQISGFLTPEQNKALLKSVSKNETRRLSNKLKTKSQVGMSTTGKVIDATNY